MIMMMLLLLMLLVMTMMVMMMMAIAMTMTMMMVVVAAVAMIPSVGVLVRGLACTPWLRRHANVLEERLAEGSPLAQLVPLATAA